MKIELSSKPAKFELLEIKPVKDWLVSCEKEETQDKTNSDCKQCRKSDFTRILWVISLLDCNIGMKLKFNEVMGRLGGGGSGNPMKI